MRRPVKPFVTEYKGAARRQPGPSGVSLRVEDEPDAPPSRPMFDVNRPASPPEDGYEAALRAADALFSSAPANAWTSSDSAERGPVSGPGGGRILQAIDDTPAHPIPAPDYAPKRRGRKPGSKNKPKIALVDGTAPEARLYKKPRSAAAARVPTDPSPRPPSSARVAIHVARPPQAPTVSRPAAAKTEQFAWVRTKLKPGENWKRRLPKVIW